MRESSSLSPGTNFIIMRKERSQLQKLSTRKMILVGIISQLKSMQDVNQFDKNDKREILLGLNNMLATTEVKIDYLKKQKQNGN